MMNPKVIYQELLKQGLAPKDAAKLAQERTGMSVVTGRPIDRGLRQSPTGKYSNGQYGQKF